MAPKRKPSAAANGVRGGGKSGSRSGGGGGGPAAKRAKTGDGKAKAKHKDGADEDDLLVYEKEGAESVLFDGTGEVADGGIADGDDLALGGGGAAAAAAAAAASDDEEDEAAAETVEDKKLRLAKQLLARTRKDVGADAAAADGAGSDDGSGGSEDDETGQSLVVRDRVHSRLTEAVQREQGRLVKPIAQQLETRTFDASCIVALKGHMAPLTSVSLTADDAVAYTSSKDCSLIRWDLKTGARHIYRGARKRKNVKGHTKPVLAVAVSSDGRFVASGGLDQQLHIWDAATHQIMHTFKGHKATISSLVFRRGSHQLFSGSFDRQVKVWDLDQMGYVDTMFGPQSEVTCVDALSRERALCAANDRTVRMWKYAEEKQLLYRAHQSSIDAVALLNDERFVSASQDGSVAAWAATKKRPVTVVRNAHGGCWVLCVAALPYTDVVASGSYDGFVRLWKVDAHAHMTSLAAIPVAGYVNGLTFANSGAFLLAAVGAEPRLGRWQHEGKSSLARAQRQLSGADAVASSRPAAAAAAAAAAGSDDEEDDAAGGAAAAAAGPRPLPVLGSRHSQNTLQLIALDDATRATVAALNAASAARATATVASQQRAVANAQAAVTAARTAAALAAAATVSLDAAEAAGAAGGASVAAFKPPSASARAKRSALHHAGSAAGVGPIGAPLSHPHAHLSLATLATAYSHDAEHRHPMQHPPPPTPAPTAASRAAAAAALAEAEALESAAAPAKQRSVRRTPSAAKRK